MDWNKYFYGELKDFRSANMTFVNGELMQVAIRRRGARKVTVKITDKNRKEPWVQLIRKAGNV